MWRLAWVLGCVGVLGLGCSRGSGGSESEHQDPQGVDMQDGGGEVVSPGDTASPGMSRPMLPRCEMMYEIDQRMDGTVDYHAVRRWRSDAQLEEIRTMNRDLVIRRTRYDYDADGRMVGYVSEDGAGDVDDSQSYTYDAQGRLESVVHDLNGDGVIDGIDRYSYDAQGHIVRFSTDNGGTGVENAVWTYTYDANGLVETTEAEPDHAQPAWRLCALFLLYLVAHHYPESGVGARVRARRGKSSDPWA
ncbi:MAG: hypothetical protein AAFS10_00105 [Myxococcota bacterium]